MRKKYFIATLLTATFLFFSCEKDQQKSGVNGMLRMSIEADTEIGNVESRVSDDTPNVGDFALSIWKGETLKESWDKFSQFPDELTLSAGTYLAKASYGNQNEEGFGKPFYEGSESFTIRDAETTSVALTCSLSNTKIQISYSEAFIKYFKDYSAEVSSYGNSPITYSKNETRIGYFKPSQISIYLNVTKQEGKPIKLFAKSIQAEARHQYNVTMDVDAGTSTIIISFDDSVTEETVQIDISDETLNTSPPAIKNIGFENGVAMDVVAGNTVPALSAQIQAKSGISKCVLKTSSESLIAMGWPAEIDLITASSEQHSFFKSLGLKTMGLTNNIENWAVIDFTGLVPNLEYATSNADHSFVLEVTDNLFRTNVEPFSLLIHSLDNQLAFASEDKIGIGVSQVELPITYAGNAIQTLKVKSLSFGDYQELSYIITESNGINYKLLVDLPLPVNRQQSFQLVLGSKQIEQLFELLPPVYEVKVANIADVWSNKATLTVVGENLTTTDYMLDHNIEVELALEGTTDWFKPAQTRNGNRIEITGLSTSSDLFTRYSVKASSIINSETVPAVSVTQLTTESKIQAPNNSFEHWNYTSGNKDYWRKYYPWSNADNSTIGWNTMNLKTTQTNGKYQYNSISGTMETSDCTTGSVAALIRTVGWGNGNTAGGSASICNNGTPGELYLGGYNESTHSPIYGIEFHSRPSAITFDCKYTPSHLDYMIAEVTIENRGETTTILGHGRITDSNKITAYVNKRIEIQYTNVELAPTHLIIKFRSGDMNDFSGSNSGNWLEKPPFANLSRGKFVGSQLYVDNVILEY